MFAIGDIIQHSMLADSLKLSLGHQHSMILKQDGTVWSAGVYANTRSESFQQVTSAGAMAAAAGNSFGMVLKQDSNVLITGKHFKAELSIVDGVVKSRRTFSFIQKIPGANGIAAGGHHSIVLTEEARVWTMGWNKYGQLGDGSTDDKSTFSRAMFSGVELAAAAGGEIHSMVLKQDGSVWAAGRNANGQLGDGSNADRNRFLKVIHFGVVGVAAGGYHSMVLKQDGSVWATGWNKYGQLGDGSATDCATYVQVVSGGAKAIGAGSRHSMMLKQDGSVWATGYNEYGQLGDGSKTNRNAFVEVISDGVKMVAAGGFHSMVLKQDDSIWATGSNKDGQFGDGSKTSKRTFVRLEPFDNGMGHGTLI